MANLVEVKIPDIGDFKEVAVIDVLVKPGDRLKAEDSLITLESDKATMDVPSPSAGTVEDVKVKVGDMVSQGTVILLLNPAGEIRVGDIIEHPRRLGPELDDPAPIGPVRYRAAAERRVGLEQSTFPGDLGAVAARAGLGQRRGEGDPPAAQPLAVRLGCDRPPAPLSMDDVGRRRHRRAAGQGKHKGEEVSHVIASVAKQSSTANGLLRRSALLAMTVTAPSSRRPC